MDEPFAARIIYPAVLVFWIYIVLIVWSSQIAQLTALIVLAMGFAGIMIYKAWLRSNAKEFDENLEEKRTIPEESAGEKLRIEIKS